MLENTIHLIVGLARAEKALFTVTGTSLWPFFHIDPKNDDLGKRKEVSYLLRKTFEE